MMGDFGPPDLIFFSSKEVCNEKVFWRYGPGLYEDRGLFERRWPDSIADHL